MNSVEEEQPKLRIWPSKYGLPSFDAAGIVTMTYAKINGISLNVQVGSIPQWTPIPSLDDGKTVVTTTPEILDVLKSQLENFNDADKKYYTNESNRIEAYKKYVMDELGAMHLIFFWLDEVNFMKITQPFFKGAIPIILNRLYINKELKKNKEKFAWLCGMAAPDEFIRLKLERVELCLTDLSERLGEKPFFQGANASSLDAIVYGYLAPLYMAPLVNCPLQNKIHALPNLQKFLRNMTNTYFPGIKYDSKDTMSGDGDDSDTAPIWQIAVASMSACAIMFVFARMHGIIRF